ncbi:hypothetical protein SUGI_0716770 [Cryptomeria japonica]|uniref:cation transporter HKT2;4 n=1 Tax=Cryptomeria japonica TaxID=3369 RepID=UPI002414CDF8|nr:cation transporter HKT2;4 [Cryptomeria japonica]GLJ35666.1 hypothetical protein SUGI_0716770 [Cryptomeria japonica]
MDEEVSHSTKSSSEGDWTLYRAQVMPIKSFVKSVEEMPWWLRKPSLFIILHVTYFIVLGFSGALAQWLCPDKNSEHMSFIDALYCCTSAVTVTGLLSVRIQGLHRFQQTVILLLTVFGSQIFTSLLPLYAKRFVYRRILEKQAMTILTKVHVKPISIELEMNEDCADFIANESKATEASENMDFDVKIKKNPACVHQKELRELLKDQIRYVVRKSCEMAKFVWNKCIWHMDCMTVLQQWIMRSNNTENPPNDMEILLWRSKYMEYMALTYLYRIVVAYFLMVQIGGIVLIQIYLAASPSASKVLEENDVNKTFFAVVNCATSFANSGFTLLDSSMIPFRNHPFILLLLSSVILLGNTMFGPSIWIIISVLERFAKGNKKEIYTYLLENPRKCYTHLFPKSQTLWLILTAMALNSIQALFFCVLDWNSKAVYGLTPGEKIVDAVFQSAATRNAGTNVVNLTDLSPPMLVLMVCMMYISVYPVYLTRQKTQDFKHIQGGGEKPNEIYTKKYDGQISVQSQKLLARDSTSIFIIIFIICILESNNISQDPLNYSIFSIIFEVISGFGNVGLSVGYSCALAKSVNTSTSISCQDIPYSLSGKWSRGGKILIILTMFLGRHRSLPDSLDSALLLPRTVAHQEELTSLYMGTAVHQV